MAAVRQAAQRSAARRQGVSKAPSRETRRRVAMVLEAVILETMVGAGECSVAQLSAQVSKRVPRDVRRVLPTPIGARSRGQISRWRRVFLGVLSRLVKKGFLRRRDVPHDQGVLLHCLDASLCTEPRGGKGLCATATLDRGVTSHASHAVATQVTPRTRRLAAAWFRTRAGCGS